MPVLTPADFRTQVAKAATGPVYVVIGDDDHEKSALAVALGEMIEEDLRAFNVERLYATDPAVTPRVVVEAAQTLPMIAPRRVIVVMQAEKLFEPGRRRKAEAAAADGETEELAGSLEALVAYLEDPSPTTTLLFVFSIPEGSKSPVEIPLAKNLKATKVLLKAATLVTCSGLAGGKDAGQWVEGQVKAAGLAIDRALVGRLVQIAGGNAARLRADVQKLLLYAAGEGRITAEHVAAVVGAPELRVADWALTNAVQAGDLVTALRELRAELAQGENGAPFRILGQLGAAVRNPRARTPYPARRIPAAVDALLRTDLAMKTSGGDPQALLERLVVELCG